MISNLVAIIAHEVSHALVQSLRKHKEVVRKDRAPAYVGVAVLGWATALQCVHLGITEDDAMVAFLRSYREAKKLAASGMPLTVVEVEEAPKAKA